MGPWGGEHQRCPEGGSVKQGALTLRPEYVKRGAPALRTTEGGEGGCCCETASSASSGSTKSPNPNAKMQDPTVDSADGFTSYVTRTSKLKK